MTTRAQAQAPGSTAVTFARRVLVANRAEVALRITRAVQEAGAQAVVVHAADDAAHGLALALADATVALPGQGPAAYLDTAALVQAAQRSGCDALHPGWGFLSESAALAQACADAGLVFIGPTPAQLALLGDKAQARAHAARCGVPVLPGLGAVDAAAATAFARQHGAVVLKALAGGGGRGLRVVLHADQLAQAHAQCAAEAQAAFGQAGVMVEKLIARARHLEVQVLGDGQGTLCVVLGDRDCTLQRRFQKLLEIAPAPALPEATRQALHAHALAMARAVQLRSLATFEFLLDLDAPEAGPWFIEANPRLQVEHTVTEAVTGLDLVQLQLAVAGGATLTALGLAPDQAVPARGCALQWRVNAETPGADGLPQPASGTLTHCHWPQGPGLRVDTHAQAGFAPHPQHDSLLAKLVVWHPQGLAQALQRSQRALRECQLDGLASNLPLLRALSTHADVQATPPALHTRWWQQHGAALQPAQQAAAAPPDDATQLHAPMAGRVVALQAATGARLPASATVLVLSAMKMEHLVTLPQAAQVLALQVTEGDLVAAGQVLALLAPLEPGQATDTAPQGEAAQAPMHLQRLRERLAFTNDAARPEAVARRHATGGRTARENIADLADAGSFIEYGALAIAAQTRRRPVDELIRQTPADGLVAGLGTVNAAQVGPEAARCALLAYDYTVLAGTQGMRNHAKTDRVLELAHRARAPVVLFAEGGGGRPGDVDSAVTAGLHVPSFRALAALSGQVPLVAVVHGKCFAGNAALAGCCDVIVATRHSNIGMGGPAMIEGGGLGAVAPEAIGPAAEQWRNGVIDLLVDDEAQAIARTKHLLGLWQGPRPFDGAEPDAGLLRRLVPENRLRAYDMRAVMAALADAGSLLELRAGFGAGIHTALARVHGRPLGLLASNPLHLGGAIDADAADKAARFLQLCSARGLPVVSLCDTPGFMVGPDIERQAQVRHVSRLFVVGAALQVPWFTVVVRRGYGLGAMAMAGGGFHAGGFTIAWPGGEFGGMGLEGAVRLGWRKELAAQADPAAREALFQQLLARQYEAGSALAMASTLEIDAVVDPADTRAWLLRGLQALGGSGGPSAAGPRRYIDTW